MKTWKERVYDWSKWYFKRWIPVILAVLGVGFILIPALIFEKLPETWINVFFYGFWFLEILTYALIVLCAAVTRYDKKTFLSNKVIYLLLADGTIVGWVTLIVVAIVASELKFNNSENAAKISLICSLVGFGIAGFMIMISAYAKKKIVSVEDDKDVMKY